MSVECLVMDGILEIRFLRFSSYFIVMDGKIVRGREGYRVV